MAGFRSRRMIARSGAEPAWPVGGAISRAAGRGERTNAHRGDSMLELGLAGKRALVAGAGHRPPRPGIGRAAALGLAEGGARVACVDLDGDRATAVAEEIRAAGGEAVVVVADLRDAAGAAAA